MRFVVFTCVLVCITAAAMANPSALLFSDPAFPATEALAPRLRDLLREAGYESIEVNAQDLANPDTYAAETIALLVLTDAGRLPMRSVEPVKAFLERGGNLLALNAPAWRERMIYVDGHWSTPEAFRMRRAGAPPPHVFLEFAAESMENWHRSAADLATKADFLIVPEGPAPGIAALEADMPEMANWDSASRLLENPPFPEGHTVTVFSARGGPNTNRLAVEFRERDGSRWIAVVPLTESWQQYWLVPEDFKFWESVPGRADSVLNPQNVDMIAFTIAYTHTGHLTGAYRFWVAQVGAAPLDDTYDKVAGDTPPPALDAVSPGYKFYEMSGVASLTVAPDQPVLAQEALPVPASLLGIHPRPEASGFDKGRPWRWMPLLEARAEDGDLRGYPAVMLIHGDGDCKGGVWASYAIGDADWYLSEAGTGALRQTLERMRTPVYFLDGGANYYTYFEDQQIRLGATLVNMDSIAQDHLDLTLEVLAPDDSTVHEVSWSALVLPGETQAVFEDSWKPAAWPEGGYRVRARLLRDDTLLDTASHEIQCWRPKANPSFVTVEKGNFMLDGERWRPHGINYMPSSGIGIEWWKYFEQWIGATAYHPNVIQRDIERCAAMGCNSLSIFIYREALEAQNLLDLLRRMDDLGMKANLSLRPGTPMDFPWDSVRELIEHYRLAENDTVFAYDLAWEPQFRDWERDPFNSEWEAWIVERYGSLENAEADWGYPVPRDDDGEVVNFEPHQIFEDGPWNQMIAAYRRFLDTLLYEKYAEARRLVRTIAPNHLVSFRMSMAGDPTDKSPNSILYDFAYLAGAVDILEPEGYGRIGDWERIKPGWFTYEYGRWANPELPVLWAEAGVHVWDMSTMTPSQERLEFQGAYFENYYRMMMKSGADGIYWWWYPGGFRTNENSDYGVINPDGTDRPVTKVIREHAERFTQAPDAESVDTWLTFNRDAHVDGLTGIYTALEGEFWSAINSGKTPGLRTEATGTDSTNCPPVAVGNVPWTGQNPPKYLDAFFDRAEIQSGDHGWRPVSSGDTVAVPAGEPACIRMFLNNLGEAALAPPAETGGQAGSVYLTVSGDLEQEIPLPHRISRFEQAVLELELTVPPGREQTWAVLRLNAEGRSPFGPKFTLFLTQMVE